MEVNLSITKLSVCSPLKQVLAGLMFSLVHLLIITCKAHNSSCYLVMCLNRCFIPELQTHITATWRIKQALNL